MTGRTPRSFLELMTLERVATDFFIGQTPQYPWGRVFGGQVVAQALAAATATVEKNHRVHSLHAYFVLGGTPGEQILYEVDRLREGRSFTTRRVVARQSGGAILNLDASFQADEGDFDIQEAGLPDGVAMPDEIEPVQWGAMAEVREITSTKGIARSQVWMRVAEELGDNAGLHSCALAYMSDHNPMDAMILSHPQGQAWDQMMTASLDHAIWFHRPIDATKWVLFDMRGHGLVNARGMSTGAAYNESGIHLATIAQEGLVRSPRPKPAT